MPGTITVAPVQPAPRRGLLVALSLILLIGAAFVAAAALPYFTLGREQFGSYWPRRWWLLAHIGFGIVALLSGPVQLWLGFTDQRPRLHRRLGLTYITSVVISSMAAFYLASHTDGGWLFGTGLSGLGVAWLVTTGLAVVAIRRQLYDQHKEWMIRSYVVTTAFVTFRILTVVLGTAGIGTPLERLALASWVCWAVPLLVTEAVLQGRKIVAVRAI
jgi:hypothetical protein